MGMFNPKREERSASPAPRVPATWPADTLDEIDDDAFAAAIQKGRAPEGARGATVAA